MKRKTKLLLRDAFFSTILSSILIAILLLVFFNIRFFNPIHKALEDFSFLDVFYSEKFYDTSKKNTDIVLINVKERNRLDIDELLRKTIEAEPKVIGFDVIFKDLKIKAIDSMLSGRMNHENIITAYSIFKDSIVYNHPLFNSPGPSGFVNFNFNDNEDTVREFEGIIEREGTEYRSIASEIARFVLGDKWQAYNFEERLRSSHTIKFAGNLDHFPYMELDDFRDYERSKTLKDKIVIMGYLGDPTGSDTDIEDKFFTPLNPYFAGRSDADMFGTVIHANIVNMLINDDFMHTIPNGWLIFITFIAMYLSTIYYMKINRNYKISFRTRKRIFQFVVSVMVLLLSFWLFSNEIVLKPAIILVGIILAGSYFKYYKHLTRYINAKTGKKWKTYLK